MPGLVDVGRGAVKHAVNLGVDGDWLPLGASLSPTGSACRVRGERRQRRGPRGAVALSGADDLVYLSIGTGLAAGSSSTAGFGAAARRRRRDRPRAGRPGGALCRCGQRGCLETIASGSAARRGLAVAGQATGARRSSRPRPPATRRAVAVRDRFAAGVAERGPGARA